MLECVHFDLEPEREVMMFRIMFNTAFIRSNILILNSENLDILWDSKSRYPKGFRAEVTSLQELNLLADILYVIVVLPIYRSDNGSV